MVAVLAMLSVVVLASAAETLHARRITRLATLAFGPSRRPTFLGRLSPWIRVGSLAAAAWGLTTLLVSNPKVHRGLDLEEKQRRHLVIVLDVSPSMKLEDAGPSGKQGRMKRASDLMRSLFARVPMQQFRVSIIAVYNGAKPVVVDTTDPEVVWNIFDELPMHYAFDPGKTRLFDGLEEAAKVAKAWEPASTSLLLISDGDTVPATNTPKLPNSVSTVLIVGVGDPRNGSFIDGRQSRQDVSTLRQVAVRLRGQYHDGNEKHLPTEMVQTLVPSGNASPWEKLTRREYALLACGLGGLAYAVLPLLLHYRGTRWSPGVPKTRGIAGDTEDSRRRSSVRSRDARVAAAPSTERAI